MAVVVTLCALRCVVGVALRLFGQMVGMALRALGCMLGVAPGLLGCVLRPAGQLRCLTLLARDLLLRLAAQARLELLLMAQLLLGGVLLVPLLTRGRVLGMNPDHKGHTIIEADVPELEIYGYGTTLRSMTGGSGDFSYEFARYEQAPSDIQAKEIEARASKVEKAEE